MEKTNKKNIKTRVRKTVKAKGEKSVDFKPFDNNRLRLVVSRSNKNIFAQITDKRGKTVLGVSTLMSDLKNKKLKKTEKSYALGEILAEKALKMGVKKVFFDKKGLRYHGRIKSFAEGARKGGLDF